MKEKQNLRTNRIDSGKTGQHRVGRLADIRKPAGLLLFFALSLSSFISSAPIVADHHVCNVGGINTCVSALIAPITSADQPPNNVLTLDFGSTPATTPITQTLTLGFTNNAGFTSVLSAIDVAGTDAAEFTQVGGTCTLGLSMPKGSTCTVDIEFTPASVGSKSATLLASTDDMTRTTNLVASATLPPPEITSALVDSGTIGIAFSYQITADYSPTSFSASNLPPGLALDANGLISGMPTQDGSFAVSISTSNASGSDSETLLITIAPDTPAINSASSASGSTGQAFNYQISASNNPTTFGAENLPDGLTIDTSSGLISGIPTTAGSYSTTSISASNQSGTASQMLVIEITPVLPDAADRSLSVAVNGETTIDLSGSVSGPFVSSIQVDIPPEHGRVSIDGLLLTYIPDQDYFGSDYFLWVAINNDGSSDAARIDVTVSGRPDPRQNTELQALLESQSAMNQRFARTQIVNVSGRLESLHRRRATTISAASLQAEQLQQLAELEQTAAQQQLQQALPLAESASGSGLPFYQSARFVNALQSLANQQALNIAYASDPALGSPAAGPRIWSAGQIRFGASEASNGREAWSFSSDGISLGIDYPFSHSFSGGLGLGYAHGDSDIGANGSETTSRATSLTFYGSYMPGKHVYLDGLLGLGKLEHDAIRYVSAIDDFAQVQRDGEQQFGSLSLGYESREAGLTLAAYGRLDFSSSTLDDAQESGVGNFALSYHDDSDSQRQFALGLRAESLHHTRFGWVQPQLRLEYLHQLEQQRDSTIEYADLVGSAEIYALQATQSDDNRLQLGFGSAFIYRDGLRLGFDYRTTQSTDHEQNSMINLWLSQRFDEKPNLGRLPQKRGFSFPINLQAGILYDDNLNRAPGSDASLSDRIVSLNLGSFRHFSLGRKSRLTFSGSLDFERPQNYHTLERNAALLRARYQYRSSGDFDAWTYGLSLDWRQDDYNSALRDSRGKDMALSVQQSLTDRIHWFASLSKSRRDADAAVFDQDQKSLKLNLDYSMGRQGSMYLTMNLQRGDAVTSSLQYGYYGNAALSDVDDAYTAQGEPAYTVTRFDADSRLFTIGYNLSLGADDSIDLSLRLINSTPDNPALSDISYTTRQVSLLYLSRF